MDQIETTKPIEQHFADWEANAFGYGYGTGEPYVLNALKDFFECIGAGYVSSWAYDYRVLEEKLTPTVAWLMINALCRVDIIEYGSSPRFGWLTMEGLRLKEFVERHTVDQLEEFCEVRVDGYIPCYPNVCNCAPHGSQDGRKCGNPFWPHREN